MASRHKRAARRGALARDPQLRVIGGEWRSRVLPVADRPGLRPTPNRIRETLFNWLAPRLEGAHCIDLFAGTGALGIEALSRGAASAVFVEQDRAAADAIQNALQLLGAGDRARVVVADATRLDAHRAGPPADIVFIDPPFDAHLHAGAVAALRGQLAPWARLYLEYPAAEAGAIDECLAHGYHVLKRATAASVGYCLARPAAAGEHDQP